MCKWGWPFVGYLKMGDGSFQVVKVKYFIRNWRLLLWYIAGLFSSSVTTMIKIGFMAFSPATNVKIEK